MGGVIHCLEGVGMLEDVGISEYRNSKFTLT